MLEAYTKAKNRMKKISMAEAAKIPKLKKGNLVWINCQDPSEKELTVLSKMVGIQRNDLVVCLDEGERARVEASPRFVMIILKAPLYSKVIETTPLGIFIKGNYILTLHIDKIKVLDTIKSNLQKDLLHKDVPHFIFHLTSRITFDFDKILDRIDHQIDVIERDILNRVSKNYIEDTFILRKTLIYFRKAIKGNSEVVKSLRLGLAFKLSSKEKERYSDLYQDARQLVDIEEINRDRLKEILNVHLSIVSIDLNKIMKSFTVIASLVLVP